MSKKTYYCPTCKKYPDKLIEVFDHYENKIMWDKTMGYYSIDCTEGNIIEIVCEKCETNCEKR